MKKTLIVSLCLLLAAGVFSAFAGGGGDSGGKKITANIASTFPPDSPQDKGMNHFKKLAAERSNGRIEIRIHPAGTMGDEIQTFEIVSQGSVEYGAIAASHISLHYPRYYVNEVPYFMSNQNDFWNFWNGPGKELMAMVEKDWNVRTDGIIFRGTRLLTANRPIRNVAELKGLKLRLPPLKLMTDSWTALGAIPTPIAFSEVYMALQTGVVEAQENPAETILAYKFYEAQKYLILTEHIHSPASMITSLLWWKTVDSGAQGILSKAMTEAVAFANEITKNGDAEFIKQLQKLGMEVIQVDKAEFRKTLQPTIDRIAREQWDPVFYGKVKALFGL